VRNAVGIFEITAEERGQYLSHIFGVIVIETNDFIERAIELRFDINGRLVWLGIGLPQLAPLINWLVKLCAPLRVISQNFGDLHANAPTNCGRRTIDGGDRSHFVPREDRCQGWPHGGDFGRGS